MNLTEPQKLAEISEKEREKRVQELLNVADMAINRTYLAQAGTYAPVKLNKTPDENCLKIFRIKRIVYSPEDNIVEKLKTFYLTLSNLPLNPSVIMIITNKELQGDEKKDRELSFFLGIRTEKVDNSYALEQMLQDSFSGTFMGSELTPECNDPLESYKDCQNLVCVSAIPSVKKDDDEKMAHIGMEQFIDVMRNKDYCAVLIANSVANSVIQSRKRDLENIYSSLSIYQKQTFTFNENDSTSVTEGTNQSFSISENTGESFTSTQSESFTESEGHSTSISHSSGSSNSFNSEGNSFGFNSSYSSSSSENWSKSQTHSFSTAKGTTNSRGVSVSDGSQHSDTTTRGTTNGITLELENKNVSNMLQELEQALEQIKQSEACGLWECAAYFATENPVDALFAANTYKALALGNDSHEGCSYITSWTNPQTEQDKIFVSDIFKYVQHGLHPILESPLKGSFHTISPTNAVNGNSLPYFFSLPLKSVPGLVVDEIAAFERSVFAKKISSKRSKKSRKETPIQLGKVFHMGQEESTKVFLDLNGFTSHCFIAGSTGSGKSNTMCKIIEEIVKYEERNINFLVIEPAKGEYKKDFRNLAGIQIFTTNPFCERLLNINPFRFPEGIHVLEHIDRLLNIFYSCWELTAAMPAILKKSIEQSYERIGWDLTNSFYLYGDTIVYPTFVDVVKTLKEVIEDSAYAPEAKSNYTGALVTRVESLASGVMHKIFCSPVDISYKDLFDSRVIVDLSRLGSSETKTLIMGIMVTLLSEYRMSVAQSKNLTNSQLQHVTIIEEAHNLLKNTEHSNTASPLVSKSVETISNAIAEMRTYGEGFIIVDQSPTAVDISAIKNTNTKIIMRLPEQSDCEAMANAMGLDENQQKEIAKLLPGKALIMQNDWTSTVMVAIDKAGQQNLSGIPEIISPEENRKIRSQLALKLTEIGYYMNDNFPQNENSTLTNGKTFSQLWQEIDDLLKKAEEQFINTIPQAGESIERPGIGSAKCAEIRNICEYYRNNLFDKTTFEATLTEFIMNILECENCWKHFINSALFGYKQFRKIIQCYVPNVYHTDPWFSKMCNFLASMLLDSPYILKHGGTFFESEEFRAAYQGLQKNQAKN